MVDGLCNRIGRENYINKCNQNDTLIQRNAMIEAQIKQNGELENKVHRGIVISDIRHIWDSLVVARTFRGMRGSRPWEGR